MKHQIFHRDWSYRINHLENLKYGVFFIHAASLGYLAINIGNEDFVMWKDESTAIWWLIFSAFWFGSIGIIQYNLFRRYIQIAHQLMVIEHLNDTISDGISFYSNRANRKDDWRSRLGLRVSGLFAEAISILWFVFVALTAQGHGFIKVYWLAVCFGLSFATMMIAYNIFHSELLKEKDEVDMDYMISSEKKTDD